MKYFLSVFCTYILIVSLHKVTLFFFLTYIENKNLQSALIPFQILKFKTLNTDMSLNALFFFFVSIAL
jgi:hypothetical protein